jgi:hypothetical protein
MDCFVACAPRNDDLQIRTTSRYDFAISRHDLPELCKNNCPSKNRGRREDRVPARTRGPCALVESTR